MKERKPKPDDQECAQFAFQLIKEFMGVNRDVEPIMWLGAFWSIQAHSMRDSGYSFEVFCEQLDRVKQHYKGLWDEESDKKSSRPSRKRRERD